MVRCNWFKRFIAAAVAAAALAGSASAGLLPVSVTITPDSGNYRWTYAIVLPTDMQLQSGNYFTIYDFNGYIPGTSQAPAGWTLTTANVGETPGLLKPTDDPNIINLTWTYTGATIPSGQIGLGNFWADSTSGTSVNDSFTSTTARTSDGQPDSNITETIVPNGSSTAPNTVPEPMTLVLAGLGLPLVGMARMVRRRM